MARNLPVTPTSAGHVTWFLPASQGGKAYGEDISFKQQAVSTTGWCFHQGKEDMFSHCMCVGFKLQGPNVCLCAPHVCELHMPVSCVCPCICVYMGLCICVLYLALAFGHCVCVHHICLNHTHRYGAWHV